MRALSMPRRLAALLATALLGAAPAAVLAKTFVLPHVLEYSAPAIRGRLARLAVAARVGREDESESVLARRFLDAVIDLERDLDIPPTLAALKEADIPALAIGARRRYGHLTQLDHAGEFPLAGKRAHRGFKPRDGPWPVGVHDAHARLALGPVAPDHDGVRG